MSDRSFGLRLTAVVGALMLAGAAHANLVTNPGFETGTFAGWTQSGNLGFTSVTSLSPHSGGFNARFGPVGSLGFITQTLVTVPGATYDVDFWLTNESGSTPNEFQFNWDGGALESSLLNSASFGYTHFVFSLTASTAATTVSFGFRHDPSFWRLDDVSVNAVAVPEPATLALIGLAGLLGAAASRRRRSAD
jgi:hypothetical protein